MAKQRVKKILVGILIVAMVVTYFPISVFQGMPVAYAESPAWSGEASVSLNQDKDGYYLISSGEDLKCFANEVYNNPTIKGRLTSCINLGNLEWEPIRSFEGIFDGGGHTISNMSITQMGDDCGFFYSLTNATVKNLTIEGNIVEDTGNAWEVGGIAALADNSTIQNCTSKVNITCQASHAGGIVGNSAMGTTTIERCSNYGNITRTGDGYVTVGGIIGTIEGADEVILTDCYNKGNISDVDNSDCSGGIIGGVYGGVLTLNGYGCFNEGIISDGNGSDFGGGSLWDNSPNYNSKSFYYKGENFFDEMFVDQLHAVTSAEEFCNNPENKSYSMNTGQLLLNWEVENLNHQDAPGATDEEKKEALKSLETYKNKSNYYEKEWKEIQDIITKTRNDVMRNSNITLSDVMILIDTAKANIDKVKPKSWIDQVNQGIKKIDDKLASIKQKDYEKADWSYITDTANTAKKQIAEIQDLSLIDGIVNEAISSIEAVMTIKQKEGFSSYKEAAKEEVKKLIDSIEKSFAEDVKDITNEETKKQIQITQQKVKEQYFNQYITEGSAELKKLADCKNNKEVDKWTADAKKYIEANKIKGKLNKIYTAEDFINFSKIVNSKDADGKYSNCGLFAMLVNDIDLKSTDFQPIGTTSYPYTGSFFGNDRTININFVQKDYTDAGVFAAVSGAHIERVTVTGSIQSIQGLHSTGGLIGTIMDKTGKDTTTVIKCTNKADILGNGGLIGNVGRTKAIITDCLNTGSITSRVMDRIGTGGILGGSDFTSDVTITNSKNRGVITGKGSRGTGGLVGETAGTVTFKGCSNSGKIIAENSTIGTGGIVGSTSGGTITECSNAAEITGKEKSGGIAGSLENTKVSYCYNEGKISFDDLNAQTMGGIAGITSKKASIQYCFNKGVVSAGSYGAGGIVGFVGYDSDFPGHVYNTGKVKSRSTFSGKGAGAIAGGAVAAAKPTGDCYALKDVSDCMFFEKDNLSEEKAFKTEQEMKTAEFINLLNKDLPEGQSGFKESNGNINDGYPVFQWQIDEVNKQLQEKKDAAKKRLADLLNLDNYYTAQQELIKKDLEKAYAEIDKITQSLGQVETVEAKWIEELRKYQDKTTINAMLKEEKAKACDVIDKQVNFSGYQKKTQDTLNSLKSKFDSESKAGKKAINEIRPEDFAGDFELVKKELSKVVEKISTIYLDNGVWNGTKVDNKYKPTCDSNRVWQIKNGVELAWLAQTINRGNSSIPNEGAVLLNDIDLGGRPWSPIFPSSNIGEYNSTFDGKGHTIYGLNAILDSEHQVTGLFGYCGENSKIQNLTVEGKVIGKVEELEGNNPIKIGGIVGSSNGKIYNCTSRVDINVEEMIDFIKITAGGIAGDGKYIYYCKNEGNISNIRLEGGIVGTLSSYGFVTFCYNSGNIDSTRVAAGIAGQIQTGRAYASRVRNCWNEGNLTTGNLGGAAGIVGTADSQREEVSNVYNRGNVGSEAEGSGIIGYMIDRNRTGTDMTVSNAYNIGNVKSGQIVTSLANGKIVNCYGIAGKISSVTDTTNYTSIDNSLILTPEELKQSAKQLGEAFCDDKDNSNNGYPVLAYQYDSEELKNAKLNALDEITDILRDSNITTFYGNQLKEFIKVENDAQKAVENAKTVEEVEEAKNNVFTEIKNVKTEIEKQRDIAYEGLAAINRQNVYSEENEAVVGQLLADAKADFEACEDVVQLIDKESSYKQQLTEIPVYTDDTIADLNEYKDTLVQSKNLSKVKAKELTKPVTDAEAAIEKVRINKDKVILTSAEARAAIDDIFNETKLKISRLAEKAVVLPDIQVDEKDPLKDEKVAAMEEVLNAVSPGMNSDYEQKDWENVKELWNTAKDEISAGKNSDEIKAAKDKAVNEIAKIPTTKENEENLKALNKEKEKAQKELADLMKKTEILSGKEKTAAKDTVTTAEKKVKEVSLKNQDLDSAIVQIKKIVEDTTKTINSALENIKKNSWADTTTEPEMIDNVYQITNANELAWIAKQVNNSEGMKYKRIDVVLKNDIDLAGRTWDAIGQDQSYRGNFDGNGHVIKNLYVYDNEGAAGLFGSVQQSEIKDLTVTGTLESEGNNAAARAVYAGGIAGIAENTTFRDCVSEVTFNSKVKTPEGTSLAQLNYGGIAGEVIREVNFERCINKGNINGQYCRAIGGIVADMDYYSKTTKFTECANLGDIYLNVRYTYNNGGKDTAVIGVGGIIGVTRDREVIIDKCYNSGKIHGVENIGGIAGLVEKGAKFKITNSYNSGKVTAEKYLCGAIAGKVFSGEYQEDIYVLKDSSAKGIGMIIIGNRIDTVNKDELADIKTVEKLNDGSDIFIVSFAGLNDGLPLFKWQLMDHDIQKQIKNSISAYPDRTAFNETQLEEVDKIIQEASEKVASASNEKGVINAYNQGIERLDTISAEMKNRISKELGNTELSVYNEALKNDLKNIIKEKNELILDSKTTPKRASELYDEAMAAVTDRIIENIDSEITVDSIDGINLARASYEKLTKEQRKLVTKYISLYKAENNYRDDKETADKTIKLISVIGNVTKESKATIEAARKSYDQLTKEQKTFVSDSILDVLEKAEAKLKQILEESSKPKPKKTGASVITGRPANGNPLSMIQKGNLIGTGTALSDSVTDEKIKGAIEESKENKAKGDDSVIVHKNGAEKLNKDKGFDWSILAIGAGILILIVVIYLMYSWFVKSKRNRRA